MEYLPNGYMLDTSTGAFPLSTDSMLLADFAKLPRNAKVLDLGAGCGTLGVLLCAKDSGCCVTGVEISVSAHQAALENIRRNHLDSRLSSICADLRSVDIEAGSYHCCISNPPIFPVVLPADPTRWPGGKIIVLLRSCFPQPQKR